MSWEGWLFILSVLVSAGLLFTMVFYIIMFSDLECDYINPIDLCNKINDFVVPEMAVHGTLTLLYLLSWQVIAFLINAPLLLYNINKYRSGSYLLDATEIFRTLSQYKKESFIKLGFYLLLFFFSLYSMIMALIADHDENYVPPGPGPHDIKA